MVVGSQDRWAEREVSELNAKGRARCRTEAETDLGLDEVGESRRHTQPQTSPGRTWVESLEA